MALTYDNVVESVFGDRRVVVSTVTFDSSYPTGGEAVDLGALGLQEVEAAIPAPNASGYVPAWDGTNILVYEAGADGAALDEVANATDLSAESATVLFIGH